MTTTMSTLPVARRIWAAVEPLASSIYFMPEAHRAYQELGFDGPSRVQGDIEFPDMVAYFTSRGACLGEHVSGHLVAAAFGVFKRPMVVDAVATGWQRTDQAAILAAREHGATSGLKRMLGDEPDGLAWATAVLTRMATSANGEGRALFSGLLSLGFPDDPMGAFWRAADLVREHRGDSHIAAWIDADLDACEIGVLTDPWRGQPLKSWVRSRGWSEDELDAAIDRLRARGYLDADGITPAGWALREEIEAATDHMEGRVVTALGADAEQLFALTDVWCDHVVAQHGYPMRVRWPDRP
jgi:Helix-turn-helix family